MTNRSGGLQVAMALGTMALGISAGAQAAPLAGGPRREPPPFAFEACNAKSVGDDCTVTFHDRSIEGSCLAYSDQRLFCMPKDMPPPPEGDHPPPRDE